MTEPTRLSAGKFRDTIENRLKLWQLAAEAAQAIVTEYTERTIVDMREALGRARFNQLPKETQKLGYLFSFYTWENAYQDYCKEANQTLKESTYVVKVQGLYGNILRPYLDKALNKYTVADFIKEQPCNKHDLITLLNGLKRAFFAFCRDEQVTAETFVEFELFKQRKERKKFKELEKKAYTYHEAVRILLHFQRAFGAESWIARYIHFALLTGMRPAEILGLQWCCIDFVNKKILIHQQWSRDLKKLTTTKTEYSREFPMSEELLILIRNLARKTRPNKADDFVFRDGSKHLDQNYFTHLWCSRKGIAYLVEKGELPCFLPIYNLRHTFINLALERQGTPEDVARYVGHSVATAAKHYRDYSDKGKKAIELNLL
jgi:integrase